MKRYTYYPGCSMKGTETPYEDSLLAVFDALDLELEELDDWNCCGATAYMSVDELQSLVLASRNLAMAETTGRDLVVPCSACYLVLQKAKEKLVAGNGHRKTIQTALDTAGLTYNGSVQIRHPLEILVNDLGENTLREAVTAPLEGVKVAPYYGCQIVRPYALFDSQDYPNTMDRLLKASGAEVVDYPYKTRCCGGSQTGTIPDVGLHLVYMLLSEAHERGANVVATICPLCQFNLELYQAKVCHKYGIAPMPVVFFTQLLGLALGIGPRELGLHKCIVSVDSLLKGRTADVA